MPQIKQSKANPNAVFPVPLSDGTLNFISRIKMHPNNPNTSVATIAFCMGKHAKIAIANTDK
jgi:hypothetical protein